jgi:nicotinate phosphoribosyltransferase
LSELRQRTLAQLRSLHPTLLRLVNPHEYPVGLEPRLHELRMQLIAQARNA